MDKKTKLMSLSEIFGMNAQKQSAIDKYNSGLDPLYILALENEIKMLKKELAKSKKKKAPKRIRGF